MEEMESGNCGPGCDCGGAGGKTKVKAAVCLIVLLGIGGIFVYKAHSAKQNADAHVRAGFRAAAESTAGVSADKTIEGGGAVGRSLASLAALNEAAVSEDAVFVFIGAEEGKMPGKETIDAIASARQRIESTGARIGLYTLQHGSPEYASIAAQVSVPGMLVMSKGRGMGAVSGGITETKILQAYVASSRVSGCGPSGCGPTGCD
ncbi:MAG: hypothetical protein IH624_11130 [Phycisphaerae bacterium]|nr:hypothetical protein [Phycisphaerae bacterium]